uniref:testis-expressed protein 264-like n=1 Tax=Ciona intestinalis TaxID=7719 RepID=UPI0002B8DEB7|nr:testis-expressed protein 264-like [Ciona intestinalis]|eukprot:XP_002124235.2 testis-expressed protein 264-like [Ciona intestinalis]
MDYSYTAIMLGPIGVFVALAAYKLGVFTTVKVSVGKPNLGKAWVAYKYYKGDFKECGKHFPQTVKDFPNLPCVGICYDYDATQKIGKGYIVGAIISEQQPPPPHVIESVELLKYEVIELPEIQSSVNAQFPFYEKVAMLSAILGAMKVYSTVDKFAIRNSLKIFPGIEIYRDNAIHYMFPLSQNWDFFVPEARQ